MVKEKGAEKKKKKKENSNTATVAPDTARPLSHPQSVALPYLQPQGPGVEGNAAQLGHGWLMLLVDCVV